MKKSQTLKLLLGVLCAIFSFNAQVLAQTRPSHLVNYPQEEKVEDTVDCSKSLVAGTNFSASTNTVSTSNSYSYELDDIAYIEGGSGHLSFSTNFSNYNVFYVSDWWNRYGNFHQPIRQGRRYYLNNDYAIVSNPNVLNTDYTSITDGKNRLIIALNGKKTTQFDILTYEVTDLEIGTDVTFTFTPELVHANRENASSLLDASNPPHDGAQFLVTAVSGSKTYDPSYFGDLGANVFPSGTFSVTFENIQANSITITLAAHQVNDFEALALSDIRVYGCPKRPDPVVTTETGEVLFCQLTEQNFEVSNLDDTQEIVWYLGKTSDINAATKLEVTGSKVTIEVQDGTNYIFAQQGAKVASIMVTGEFCCASSPLYEFVEDFGTTTGPKRLENVDRLNTYRYPTETQNGLLRVTDGYYAVVSNIDQICASCCSWPGDKRDHTGNENGAFLLLNAGTLARQFYEIEITDICPYTYYTLSLWAANVATAGWEPGEFRFEVFSVDERGNTVGQPQGSDTGPIPDMAEVGKQWSWHKFSYTFLPESNGYKTYLRLYTTSPEVNGNDIVVDDIRVIACMPEIRIDLQAQLDADGKAECGEPVYLSAFTPGGIASYFPNPYYIWQRSIDGGPWEDIKSGFSTASDAYSFTPNKEEVYEFRVIVGNTQAASEKLRNGQPMDFCETGAISNVITVESNCECPDDMTAPELEGEQAAADGSYVLEYCEGDAFPEVNVKDAAFHVDGVANPSLESTTLEWYSDAALTNELVNADGSEFKPVNDGVYYAVWVYRYNVNECYSDPTRIEIKENPLPAASISVEDNVDAFTCGRESLVLTAPTAPQGIAYVYEWSYQADATATASVTLGSTTNSVKVTDPGVYTVKITNAATACYSTASVVLKDERVNPDKPLAVQDEYFYCYGATSFETLEVQPVNDREIVFEWYDGEREEAGSKLLNPNVGFRDQGNRFTPNATDVDQSEDYVSFYVYAKRTYVEGNTTLVCYSDVTTIKLTKNTLPTVTISALGNVTNLECGLESLTLTANASGNAPFAYSWSNSSTNQSIDVVQAGNYQVTVTDANACKNTATQQITANNTPVPVPTADVVTYPYCSDAKVPEMHVNPLADSQKEAGAEYYIEWYDEAITAPGANDKPLHTGEAYTYTTAMNDGESKVFHVFEHRIKTLGDNDEYTVHCYSTDYQTITLTKNTLPTVTINPYGNVTNLECGLDELNLSVTANGNGTLTYLWNDGVTTGDRVVTADGTYTLKVTDANGCENTASVTITDNSTTPAAPTVAQSNYAYCADAAAPEMSASSPNADTDTEKYYVEWYESENRSSAPINTGLTYTYDQLNDGESKTFYLFTRRVKTIGTATENYIAECYSTDYQTITLTKNALPTVNINPYGGVTNLECGLEELKLSVTATGNGTLTYSWNDGVTTADRNVNSAGIYTLTVTDANGCENTASVTITDNSTTPAAPTVAQSNYAYCADAAAPEMSASSPNADTDTEKYFVEWYEDANRTSAAVNTGLTYTYSQLNDGESKTFYLFTRRVKTIGTATENYNAECYSADYAEVTLTKNALPTVNISAFGGVTNLECGLDELKLTVAATGNGTLSYSWNDGVTTADRVVTADGTYTLTVTDANGCDNSADITITDNSTTPAAPNVAQSNYAYCADAAAPEMSASSPNADTNTEKYYVEWYEDANRTSAAVNTGLAYTYSQLNDGESKTFYLFTRRVKTIGTATENYTAECYSADYAEVTLTKNALPTVTINPYGGVTNLECGLDQLKLTVTANGNGALTYSWNDGVNTSDRVVTTAGDYTLTVTDANGCENTASVNITDNSTTPAAPTVAQSNYAYCADAAAPEMSATAAGTDSNTEKYYVEWYESDNHNGTPINTGLTYTYDQLNDGESKTFYLFTRRVKTIGTATENYTAECYSTDYQTITLTKNALPTVTINPYGGVTNLECGLAELRLSVTANGNGALTYSWNDGVTTSDRNVNAAGTYTLTVTDANGCSNSADITITDNSTTPAAPTVAQSNYAYCADATAPEMSASSPNADTNTEKYYVEWYEADNHNGTPINTGLTYTYDQLNDGESKTFYLFTRRVKTIGTANENYTAECYSTDYQTITLTKNALPTVNINPYGNVTNLECGLAELKLTVTANGNGALTYSWNDGVATADRNVNSAGTYTLTVTDANGCENTADITITDNSTTPATPTVAQSNYAYCADDAAPEMSATAAGTDSDTEKYYVEWYEDANRTSAAVNTGLTYTYSQLNDGESKTFYLFTRRVKTIGTASESYNAECYSADYAEVTLTKNALPTVTINPYGGVTNLECGLDELKLSVTANGNGALTYSWNDGVTTADRNVNAAGTYTLTVTDANGCENTASVTITDNSTTPAAPTVAQGNYAYCADATAPEMSASSPNADTNTETYYVEWYEDANRTSAAVNTGITYTYSQLNDGESKTFYLFTRRVKTIGTATENYTAECYSTDYAEVTLTKNALPTVTINPYGGVTNLECGLDELKLTVAATGNGTLTYSWNDGVTTSDRNVNAAGTYTITITDANGCENTADITITDNSTTPAAPTVAQSNYAYCADAAAPEMVAQSAGTDSYTEKYYVEWYEDENRSSAAVNTGLTYTYSQLNDGESKTFYLFTRRVKTIGTATENYTAECYSTDYAEVTITKNALPTVTINPYGGVTNLECGLAELKLMANGTAVAPANIIAYEWTGGAEGEEFTVSAAGTYTVTAIDNNACTASASIDITEDTSVPAAPDPVFNVYQYCTNDEVPLLQVEPATADNVVALEWYATADRSTPMLTEGETYQVPEAIGAGRSRNYYVFTRTEKTLGANGEYKDVVCYSNATRITLTENALPNVMITIAEGSAVIECGMGYVTLEGPDAPRRTSYSYEWKAEGEVLGDEQYLEVSEDGWYHLTVTNDDTQCSASNEIRVLDRREHCDDPEPEPLPDANGNQAPIDIIIPVYFTPNGDGVSDTWDITNIEYFPNAIIEIYDRHSRLLRRYTGADAGWDGTYNNHPMPMDDYWYYIRHSVLGVRSGHFILKR